MSGLAPPTPESWKLTLVNWGVVHSAQIITGVKGYGIDNGVFHWIDTDKCVHFVTIINYKEILLEPIFSPVEMTY